MSAKKGFVYSINDSNLSTKISSLNVNWFYDWNTTNPNVHPIFTPMIWSLKSIINLPAISESNGDGNLLCFNEPDNSAQANMTADQAVAYWPQLMATGLRLGSPATASNSTTPGGWFDQFMNKLFAEGYDVDFISVHWYAPPNPSSLLKVVDTLWTTYNKPIWITEFAVADWSAKTTGVNKYIQQDSVNFLNTVIPELEKRDYVERYAWKTRSISDPCLSCSAIFNDDGSLTDVGKAYSAL